MIDENSMTPYENKVRRNLLTNAGRQIFLEAGDGLGTIVYTRATLSSQKLVDVNGNEFDNNTVREINNLADDLKEGQIELGTIADDHFDVIADFNNENQFSDVSFNTVGWYARLDTVGSDGGTTKGKEVLMVITEMTDQPTTLPACSADGLSTQSISIELDMAISNAADIKMTAERNDYVTHTEFNVWKTKIIADIKAVSLDPNIDPNIDQIKENTTHIQEVQGAGKFVQVYLTDQNGTYITDQNGARIVGNKWLPMVDKTLTQSDLPADAKAVGDAIKDAVALKPEEYGIPVLYLYGDQITSLKDKSKTLKDTVTYKFPQYNIQGTLKNIKVQGASSVRYPEKNYTLTFDQDFAAFEDYGRQHKYVIKANWTDFSQAKNVVGAQMWSKVRHLNDVKNVSSIIDDKGNYLLDNDGNHIVGITDPQLAIQGAGAIDGFPIVVYINNQFWGLYTFNIPKDAWMAKMPEKANYAIVSAEAFSPQTEFKAPTNLDDGLSLEFCGTDDSTWVKNSLNKLISVAMEDYDTAPAFDAKISSVLDMQSAIDYMVYMLLIDGVDNIDKNYLLQTYNGEKWYFTAYDMDETLGWAWENKLLRPDSDGLNVTLENITNGDNRLYYQIFKFHKEEILQELKDLVAGTMSPENVRLDFAYFVRDINTTLYSEDAKKWGNKPNTSIINYQYIVDWYERRTNWIKNKYLAD